MKQYGFYVDSSRCSGCKTCQVSCKDNKDLDVGPKLRRVYEYGGGSWVKEGESWHHDTFTYYLSIACNHCDEPVCVSGCPTGAMHKRKEDGLVVVDDSVCVGCRYCEMRCPYGRGVKLSAEDIWDRCAYVLSVKMQDPQFAGQTKERLSSRQCAAFVSGVVKDAFSLWLNQNVQAAEQLAEMAIASAQRRLRAMRRSLIRRRT
ncbi:Anaerobic dimethyl sulfoxide reductase chain B, partial [Salmonella enterica subsp. enterica serovar Inverness str. R8-3668]